MQISWLGNSCFKVQSKDSVILIEPYSQGYSGLKMPSFQANIVTLAHPRDQGRYDLNFRGPPFIISGPGEYEVKDIFVFGLSSSNEKFAKEEKESNTIYLFTLEDLTLAHLGDLKHELADSQLEILEDADILLVPVGGGDALTAKGASEVISQVEPKIVIPMHFKNPGLKLKLDPLSKFCSEMGIKETEGEEKLKIQKKDLPEEGVKIILLKSLK